MTHRSLQITRSALISDNRQLRAPCRARFGAVLVLATYAVLAFRLFQTINAETVNIFYWDQWDFNDPILFHPQSLWQAFNHQHGPHRQGVGSFIELLVGRLSHWNNRSEAFAIGIVIVIAGLCALWLKERLYGFVSYSDVIIPMIFVTRVQWETYLASTNLAHGSLPLLLMMLYCLAWTSRKDALKYPLVLITNFLAIYTGFGVFLGFITPVLLGLDYHHKAKQTPQINRWPVIVAGIVSVGSIAVYFRGYVPNPAVDCFSFPYPHPTYYFLFISVMLGRFFGAKGFYLCLFAGVFLLACLVAIGGVRLRRVLSQSQEIWGTSVIILVLLSYSLLFGAGAAIGRVCLGLDAAQASRYMIYLVPGFLGLYFHLLSLEGKLRKGSLITFGVLSLLASFPSGVAHKGQIGRERRNWKNCYLQLEDIERCDELTKFTIYPVPEATHLKEKLDFLKRHQFNLYAK